MANLSVTFIPSRTSSSLVCRCLPDWCWSSSFTGWTASWISIENINRYRMAICSNWERILSGSILSTAVPSIVYGQKVIVEMDYKPLLGILGKAIASWSPRIHRMRWLLQTCEFQLVYKTGKKLDITDVLIRAPESRQFVEDSSQFSDETMNVLPLSLVLAPTY